MRKGFAKGSERVNGANLPLTLIIKLVDSFIAFIKK